MKKSKILVVAHSGKVSGANKSLLSVLDGLKDKYSFSVVINEANSELSFRLGEMGIHSIDLDYSWWYTTPKAGFLKNCAYYLFSLSKYWFFRARYRINSNQFADKGFSLVYTNTSTVDFGSYVSRFLGIPHVWHVREFGEEDFSFRSLVSLSYRKSSFLSASRIIAVSKALASYIEGRYCVTASPVYNGFNLDMFSPIEPRPRSGNLKVLICGQVIDAKGQRIAIESIRHLINSGRTDVELFIAGEVNRDYISVEEQRSIEHKLPVHFLGFVNDVRHLRSQMHVELCCSKSEAFGRSTLEGMLSSLAVVASNSGSNPELVNDGENGLLFNTGSALDLSSCLIRLADDDEFRILLANNAGKFARSFSIEKTVSQVDSLFESAIIDSGSTNEK